MNATADALMGIFGMKRVKAKKCKHCKTPFVPDRPFRTWCSPDCAIEIMNTAKAKKAMAAAKESRKKDRERREKLKSRADWLKEAQQVFNAFIRARDQAAGYPCISSGRPLDWSGNGVDAGHYRCVGAAAHLRFNEDNCHAQSKKDNQWLSGNAVDYRINLIKRIGLDRVEALESDNEPKKYSIDDLKAIKAEFKEKLKLLLNN